MFVGWFTLAPRCASCGLSFERDEREDYWLGAAQMIVTPIVFYPFSKALWLAGDLVFRPAGPSDFEIRD
jgi:uncharacterized protein (DUF983 family)